MTDTTTQEGPDQFVAAEYVLGLLSRDERIAFAQRVASDRNVAEDVRFWEERFMPLIKHVVSVAPPPFVFQKIEQRLFAPTVQTASAWQSLMLWRGLSFAAFAAFAVMSTLYLRSVPVLQNGTTSYVATVAGTADTVKLVAYYDAASNVLKFNRVAGVPTAGRSLQLWLIAGAEPPVSLGVLPDAKNGVVSLADPLKSKVSAGVLAISDEPLGGSPTGQPTGAVLATGKLELL